MAELKVTPEQIAALDEKELKKAFLKLSIMTRCEHETKVLNMIFDELNARRNILEMQESL